MAERFDAHDMAELSRTLDQQSERWWGGCHTLPLLFLRWGRKRSGESRGRFRFGNQSEEGTGSREGQWKPGDRDPVLWRVDGEQPFSLTSLFLSRIFCPWGKLLSVGKTPHGEVLLHHPHWRGFAEGRGEGGCSPAPELTRQLLWRQVSQGSPWAQPSLCTWHEKFINHSNGQIHGGQTALCHHSPWE